MAKKGKSLVIVESLTKAKTINRYLGKDFVVTASGGHIRDLPKSTLGIDLDNDYTPRYVMIYDKRKIIDELKKLAKGASQVLIASDPDREGEAIAFHIAHILKDYNTNIKRIIFHEITKNAIIKAADSPMDINLQKVNAQQARRILDRLVGYKISPLLWQNLKRGLSAGRVQTVALRLICEREVEIEEFKPEEFWTLSVLLENQNKDKFEAKLFKIKKEKAEVHNQDEAELIEEAVKNGSFSVSSIEKKQKRKNPPPPFITSSLQQEAATRFGYSGARTMKIAQQLYEGIDIKGKGQTGLITYMRTDSVRIANDALADARKLIEKEFTKNYLPSKPRVFKNRKSAQDAHEAIRPSDCFLTPEKISDSLSKEQYNIYSIIWRRFIASQMKQSLFDTTTILIDNGDYTFKASGSILKFDGYKKVFNSKSENNKNEEDKLLPDISKEDSIKLDKFDKKQNFTKPPARFNHASLVKKLESLGIGRPSTYATITQTLLNRNYIITEKRAFVPTSVGRKVEKVLVELFPDYFNVKFTADMENQLDTIEEDHKDWIKVIHHFYGPLDKLLKDLKNKNINKITEEKTDILCEKCNTPMIIKLGQNGEFLACSNYPKCKNTKNFERDADKQIKVLLDETTEEKCEKCDSPMIIKYGRYGKFLACSNFPKCKNTKPLNGKAADIPTDEDCPKCGKKLVIKESKYGSKFVGCSGYPKCRFMKPVELDFDCPKEGCSGKLTERRARGRRGVFYSCSKYPDCDFTTNKVPTKDKTCAKCGSNYMLKNKTKDEYTCPKCGEKPEEKE